MLNLIKKDKAILAGLFLSKFDKNGLKNLGFYNFKEYYNVIGYSLDIKPSSIKNYRDEFDPYFQNKRKGWHKRKMRINCKKVYEIYSSTGLKDFVQILKKIIYKDNEVELLIEKSESENLINYSFAKRLITGKSAENYFLKKHGEIDVFNNFKIEDTTNHGCGFDFKLTSPSKNFFGVEVEGIYENSGNISLTNKEYSVAKILKNRYFLFIVKNFREKPSHIYYQNPLHNNLSFKKKEKIIKNVSWTTYV